jgi:hypothetical protein
MATIIDTSLLIPLIRDASKRLQARLTAEVGGDAVILAEPVRFELLQGARNEADFARMLVQFAQTAVVTLQPDDWVAAAQLSFKARTLNNQRLRSSLDACIAQIAIRTGARLLHNDRDFEAIAAVSALNQVRVDISQTP